MPFMTFRTIKPPARGLLAKYGIYYRGNFVKDLQGRLNGALDDVTKELDNRFAPTYEAWDHKVEFKDTRQISKDNIYYQYGTNSNIYKWVDKGTKPHAIAPKDPEGHLSFMWAGMPGLYLPKTMPNVLASSDNEQDLDERFVGDHVNHPGIKARNFTSKIRRQIKPVLLKRVRDAFSSFMRS